MDISGISGVSGSFGYGQTPQEKAILDTFNAYLEAFNDNSPETPAIRRRLDDLLAKDHSGYGPNVLMFLSYFDQYNNAISKLKEQMPGLSENIQATEQALQDPHLTPAQKKALEGQLQVLETKMHGLQTDLNNQTVARNNIENNMSQYVNQVFA